ncbi:protein N-terminal glutamine amidohydrolase-like isoform X2 [Paramacrobiotus metropolitanus]|uniref:protein N-terminal glutamine amidohydrolase-like isoform X2 n=1 Tax=Paramacrobiotus metropolitanus TaxID=2943436 RepID=UPI002446231D|nr:protein N-terminal glutamine amidohydrolase-like isoform X2 [Paramacrobiotus metropolitanus]
MQGISAIDKVECVYTACYCEENVWKLCDQIRQTFPQELEFCLVIFISNERRCISVWNQATAPSSWLPVLWDYHVVLLYCPPTATPLLFDLDSTLPFPCPLDRYLAEALRPGYPSPDPHANLPKSLRLIPAAVFLTTFASDRSHMLASGHYLAPPPAYPCIQSTVSRNNIQEFINMDSGYGIVLPLKEFADLAQARRLQTVVKSAADGRVSSNADECARC